MRMLLPVLMSCVLVACSGGAERNSSSGESRSAVPSLSKSGPAAANDVPEEAEAYKMWLYALEPYEESGKKINSQINEVIKKANTYDKFIVIHDYLYDKIFDDPLSARFAYRDFILSWYRGGFKKSKDHAIVMLMYADFATRVDFGHCSDKSAYAGVRDSLGLFKKTRLEIKKYLEGVSPETLRGVRISALNLEHKTSQIRRDEDLCRQGLKSTKVPDGTPSPSELLKKSNLVSIRMVDDPSKATPWNTREQWRSYRQELRAKYIKLINDG